MKIYCSSSLLLLLSFLNEIFPFSLGFPWDVIFYPSGLIFFWVFFSTVCLYYHLLLLKKKPKKQKNHYIISSNRGPWQIHVSFQKKEHHLRRLLKTSFSFILYHSLQYHLNSMFYFSLGPMFFSAFLRDWGVVSFDILTVTVKLQLWARHWKLLCH